MTANDQHNHCDAIFEEPNRTKIYYSFTLKKLSLKKGPDSHSLLDTI